MTCPRHGGSEDYVLCRYCDLEVIESNIAACSICGSKTHSHLYCYGTEVQLREDLLNRYEVLTPDIGMQNRILRQAADAGDPQAIEYWVSYTKEKMMSDVPTGQGDKLRNEGIARVTSRVSEEWKDQYVYITNAWFWSLELGHLFIGEDLRIAVKSTGLKDPSHPNVWGARSASVLTKWKKLGLIEDAEWCKAKANKAHSRMYPQYRKIAQFKCEVISK